MHARVRQALEYCRAAGIRRAVFVVPFELSAMQAAELRADPCCGALVTRADYSSDGLAWRLPATPGTIVFLGAWLMLTRRMRAQIRGRGQRVVPCVRDGAFCSIPLAQFRRWAAKDRVVRWLGGLAPQHLVVRGVHAARRVGALRRVWHGFMQREASAAPDSGDDETAFYRDPARRRAGGWAEVRPGSAPGRPRQRRACRGRCGAPDPEYARRPGRSRTRERVPARGAPRRARTRFLPRAVRGGERAGVRRRAAARAVGAWACDAASRAGGARRAAADPAHRRHPEPDRGVPRAPPRDRACLAGRDEHPLRDRGLDRRGAAPRALGAERQPDEL